MTTTIDVADLPRRVKDMYEAVATRPDGSYHFEMGRDLAERLGYPAEAPDRVPPGAVESFAARAAVAAARQHAQPRAPSAFSTDSASSTGATDR